MAERNDEERPRRRRDDDDRDRPRQRRNEVNTKVPCPKCGDMSVRSGPWPWYLGTVGAIMCKAVICNECGHEYDHKWTKYIGTRTVKPIFSRHYRPMKGFSR